ncbi:MAG: RlmE family RNA methyltransferase [Betaproteobacteria bacterium]
MPRTKTSKAWLQEHVNDPWVQKAKAEGYRSRAAFKLLQIDAKDKLLKPGMTVVDLGATPGGWSQVAAKIVGPAGKVVAVDLLEMEPLHGVEFIRGDFYDDGTWAAVEAMLSGRPVDIVLSDMAPNLSGVGMTDQARSIGLAELALDAALRLLPVGGSLLVKVFHGAGFEAFMKGLREHFAQVAARKPDASRGRSAETYLLARGRRPGAGTNQG